MDTGISRWVWGGAERRPKPIRRAFLLLSCVLVALVLAVGCGRPAPTLTAVVPTLTDLAAWTASPTDTPGVTLTITPTPRPTSAPSATATQTQAPTAAPTSTPTPTIAVSPTAHPMEAYTIDNLRERAYPGGQIEVRWMYTATAAYTRYFIAYPSDGLTITGVMCVPRGQGPFPVVIMNHGYIAPSEYWSGADTWYPSEYLAERGYLTIAPDFRGWGKSDFGTNFLRTGLVIDALNLVSSLPSLPKADPERVGMWGHSMGGGAAAKAIVIDARIKAAVLYAPVSADDWQVWQTWGPWMVDFVPDDPFLVVERNALADPRFLHRMSALYYMDCVTAAVQIHQGMKDVVTPPEWSAAIHDALNRAGKRVEYYAYEGQGHAIEGPDWALFMRRVTRFFDEHLR